ncbi:hypothetical protein [Tenacibaculum ovolyticum]|uniref:hypothetical protein n=1 Tax=Tenacibaculum ovolyticum TaxID=104270 RepID=UPI001F2647E0|nr:hypothetical protein [Tenacibaculum ovolyticum]
MKEKRIYYLDFYIPGELMADFYINDIKIRSLSSGNGYEELNPYILNSGVNLISIKMYSPNQEYLIKPEYINIDKESLSPGIRTRIYTSNENNENIQMINDFNFPVLELELPIYEASWTFEAEVPYKLEGWRNAQDLTKIDKEKLEKKVVAKFKEYREMLNSGDVDSFLQERDQSDSEAYFSKYFSKKTEDLWRQNIPIFLKKQKGIMLPLENYKMKFYGDGRLVTLERIDNKEIIISNTSTNLFGKSALLADNKKPDDDGIQIFYDYVLLMMEEGSDKLKMVRFIDTID